MHWRRSVSECREGVSTPLYPCGFQGSGWLVPPAVPPDAILTHPAPADSSRSRAPRDVAIADQARAWLRCRPVARALLGLDVGRWRGDGRQLGATLAAGAIVDRMATVPS